ncbi:MAG: hypothetical protein AB9882_15825 [Ignavibacteriaceae bacterium]
MAEIKLKIVIDGKEAIAALNLTESELADLRKSLGDVTTAAKNTGQSTASSFANFGNIITGVNQGIQLARQALDMLMKPLNVAGQFEGYETSLKVMLGGTEAAKARLEELTMFAANTPFELPDVITLGNQLQAISKYSIQTMTDLGDLAAASGKPIDQVTGAFAKLATGQKGIAVDMFRDMLISTDDWVKATGKGVDKMGSLMATTQEMLAALPEIIKSKNFSGMMAEQSKTFNGMMSNLSDSVGGVMRDIGMAILPVAKSIIGILTPALSFLKDTIGFISPVLGILTAGIIAYGVAAAYGAIVTAIHGMAITGFGTVTGLAAAKIMIVTAAHWLWNTAIMANPIGALILGITAAIGVVILLADAFSVSAQERLDDAKATQEMIKQQKDSTRSQIKEKESLQDLVKEYELLVDKKNKTAKETARLSELYVIINDKYPGLVKSTGTFTSAMDLAKTGSNKLTGEISALTTAYDKLSEQALIASRNVSIAGRDVAADLLFQQIESNKFGEGGISGPNPSLANEEQKQKANIDKWQTEAYEKFKKNSWAATTELELQTILYEYQNKMSEIQKSNSNLIKATNTTETNRLAAELTKNQINVVNARGKTAETLKSEREQAAKDEAERKKKEAEAKRLEDLKNNSSKTTKSELVGEKDMLSAQKQEEALLKEDKTKSNLDQLALEKKHLEAMLKYYTEYSTKDKDLKKDLADKTLETTNELAVLTLKITNEQNAEELRLQKEFEAVITANYEKRVEEQNQINEATIAENEKLDRLRIGDIQNEFDRQQALADFEYELAVSKYGDLESLALEHAKKEAEIDQLKQDAQIQATQSTLSTLKSVFGEQTVAYKVLAGIQITIDTITAAMSAYKTALLIPIIGPIMAPIAAAAAAAFGAGKLAELDGVKTEGFAQGGILPKGKAGFIEGYYNELIAPEKTFIDVVNTNIIPALNINNNNNRMADMMEKMFTGIDNWATSLTVVNRLDSLDYENTRYNNIKLRYSY